LPPLFGLTKTSSGTVPDGAVIWNELELSASTITSPHCRLVLAPCSLVVLNVYNILIFE